MILGKEDKMYLVQLARQYFDISDREVCRLAEGIVKLSRQEENKVIYELQYWIFKHQDPEYTRKLVHCVMGMCAYLYKKKRIKTEEQMFYGILRVLDFIFIERCKYVQEMEAQALISQHILKSMSNRLNAIIKTQENMIANLSHEMRTSLNTIHGYLNILEESDSLRGEQRFQLKKAIHGASSLQFLVKDILNITKINSGQLEIQQDYFAMDEMLIQCIDHLAMAIKSRTDIVFEFDSMFMPFEVYGDQVHIMEIIINFLTNAFKYTDEGFVRFKMVYSKTEEGVDVKFSVSDSGVGMSAEEINEVFSPYSRYQKEKQGLGLGMHITKQLSDRLGGTLEVQSEVGKGTTFSFCYHFAQTRAIELPYKGKKIYFYIDKSMRENRYIQDKIEMLKQNGITVKVFKTENKLINFLLSPKKEMPDIFSIISTPQSYTKIDALIYYLRSGKHLEKTVFIAENMTQHLSLKYFDDLYEYCAPIKTYVQLFKNERVKKKGSGKGICILVIDDTETNLDIFKLFVQKLYPEARVDLANGGYKGIGMYKIKAYDVVFVDLKMPGMNGFDVMDKLKELDKPLPPIYAFTADVYRSTYDKVQECGFEGILEKPLHPESLANILKRIDSATTS